LDETKKEASGMIFFRRLWGKNYRFMVSEEDY
jgi:hypothetical protein